MREIVERADRKIASKAINLSKLFCLWKFVPFRSRLCETSDSGSVCLVKFCKDGVVGKICSLYVALEKNKGTIKGKEEY